MAKAGAVVALTLVYGFNAVIAFAASVLAVGGDGSSTNVLFVGTIFAVAIASCLGVSIGLAMREMYVRSVLCGIAALPLAFGIMVAIWWFAASIKGLAT